MKRARETSMEREVEASRKRLCQLREQDYSKFKEIEKIDHDMNELREKRMKLRLAHQSFSAGPLETAISSYSQACSLALATKIQTCLPRELRDLVYSYLIQDYWAPLEKVITFHDYQDYAFVSGFRPACVVGPGSLKPSGQFPIPHIVDKAYVGHSTALEVVESFYRTTDNYGQSQFFAQDLKAVKRLVSDDIFRVGLNPAATLRHMFIQLEITQDALLPGKVHGHTVLTEGLEPLTGIVNKSGFDLFFSLEQVKIQLSLLEDFLDVLRPFVNSFTQDGASVKAQFLYGYGGFQWDLSRAIKDPESGWKSEMLQALDKDEDIANRHRIYRYEDHTDYEPPSDTDQDDDSEDSEFDQYDDGFLPFDVGSHSLWCMCPLCVNHPFHDPLDIDEEDEEDDDSDGYDDDSSEEDYESYYDEDDVGGSDEIDPGSDNPPQNSNPTIS